MLILTRKPGESLYIGDVKVTIVELKGHQIRIGIDAPPEIRIYREEIYLQIMEENKRAAETQAPGDSLDSLVSSWKGVRKDDAGQKDAEGHRITFAGSDENKPPRKKLDTYNPSSTTSNAAPQVIIKRKKKSTDE